MPSFEIVAISEDEKEILDMFMHHLERSHDICVASSTYTEGKTISVLITLRPK